MSNRSIKHKTSRAEALRRAQIAHRRCASADSISSWQNAITAVCLLINGHVTGQSA